MVDVNSWFDSPAGATCGAHGRAAESVCSRCGGFQCDWCVSPQAGPYCASCAALVCQQALPRLSFRAAWKLLFVPVVGLGCLAILASRGTLFTALASHHLTFLALWLVPFTCGLWLLARPASAPAFVGSVTALALVAFALLPPLLADFTQQHALDFALLAAGPIVALRDAYALNRAHQHARTMSTLAALA